MPVEGFNPTSSWLLCCITLWKRGAVLGVLLLLIIAYRGARDHATREAWCRANVGERLHAMDEWRHALDVCIYSTACARIGPPHPAILLGGRGPLRPWNASTFYAPSDRVLRLGTVYVCHHWHTPCDPAADLGGIWFEQ
jgi:hypothetical protein